ncbi:hypothetical protein AAG742_10075 [Micrococcus sp. 2A]|uniref:hypothetical protein n=1 Tax=Micrococcus TaxID=1269 RepID=UPI002629BB78|nr:hypothetical protein [uncultured Micrococcus sp.]
MSARRLRSCSEETTTAATCRAIRADIVADVAGLDPERVRAWTFVRLVLNAVDAAEEGEAKTGTPKNSAEADAFRTHMIGLAGAFAS